MDNPQTADGPAIRAVWPIKPECSLNYSRLGSPPGRRVGFDRPQFPQIARGEECAGCLPR
ncbi:MAG: hypothetical protein MI923_11780 [Phycisphaerales bacterium]|nr:hypothetical protein [Phycisphaerales bacterium]